MNTYANTGKTRKLLVKIFVILIVIATLFAGVSFLLIRRASLNALDKAREELNIKELVELELVLSHSIEAPLLEGLEVITTSGQAYDIVKRGSLFYVATLGGLLIVSSDGTVAGPYTSQSGLLSHALTSLADIGDEGLLLGSVDGEVTLLKEETANIYRFSAPKPTGISQMLAAEQGIALIGTFAQGVIVFDRGRVSKGIMEMEGANFKDITALASCEAYPLAVGTARDGVFVLIQRAFKQFTLEHGLMANEITSLTCAQDGSLIIGTPQGAAILDNTGGVRELARDLFISALAQLGESVYAGTIGDGLVVLHAKTGKILDKTLQGKRVNRLRVIDGKVYVLTSHGVFVMEDTGPVPLYTNPRKELPSNHITALEADPAGNVWVGTFEHGAAILSTDGTVNRLPGSDQPKAVNYIAGIEGKMYIATTWGVFIHDGRRLVNKLGKEEGLISEQVSAIGISDRGPVYATAAGVTLSDRGLLKSIYVFHGLANNHTYCTLSVGSKTYVGTLGGLSVIENMQVLKNYSAASDGLPANWITSLATDGNRIYVGTYGKGLAFIDNRGKVGTFENEPGDYEVNLNTIAIDGNLMYVGSLDRGLMIYDLAERTFARNFTSGLPSPNVTAIELVGKKIYIGTDRGIAILDRDLLKP